MGVPELIDLMTKLEQVFEALHIQKALVALQVLFCEYKRIANASLRQQRFKEASI